jgi:hypothetical protein
MGLHRIEEEGQRRAGHDRNGTHNASAEVAPPVTPKPSVSSRHFTNPDRWLVIHQQQLATACAMNRQAANLSSWDPAASKPFWQERQRGVHGTAARRFGAIGSSQSIHTP